MFVLITGIALKPSDFGCVCVCINHSIVNVPSCVYVRA